MCRFLAYHGAPIYLEDMVASPSHSLIAQSLHATEGKTEINGDGFGLGWYGEREHPGLFRDLRPAWSDENLQSICSQMRSRLFFAHVRAATGTATTRANCHPFAAGRFMFMHNGQVGGFQAIRRRVEALIPDEAYPLRGGTTDSEAIFLACLGHGLERDPPGAVAAVLAAVRAEMDRAGIAQALRFTAALTDGRTLWAFRWSSDERPPSLYYRRVADGLVVVSEPTDDAAADWHALPPGSLLTDAPGQGMTIRAFDPLAAGGGEAAPLRAAAAPA
ncbi:MAG: class II glutamine amidotransferase [Proteobacteria bacterium]|nr:class II glutamine amidotransferase [Pseudomonadota bacterium]